VRVVRLRVRVERVLVTCVLSRALFSSTLAWLRSTTLPVSSSVAVSSLTASRACIDRWMDGWMDGMDR
jgi:hypothetical protein